MSQRTVTVEVDHIRVYSMGMIGTAVERLALL